LKHSERNNFILGFTDEDLEKPNFPGKQSSEKIPFILSDIDNPPVVQVSSFIVVVHRIILYFLVCTMSVSGIT
jgi:hypothetical protein